MGKNNNFSLLIALDEEGNASKGTVYIDDGLSVDADYSYVEIITEKVSEGNYKISFITEKKGVVDEISVDKIVLADDSYTTFAITYDEEAPLKLGKEDFEIFIGEQPDDDTTTETPSTSASSILKFAALS